MKKITDKHYLLLSGLLILLLYGAYLRFFQISKTSYWIDESYTINAAQAILHKGIPLLDSGSLYGGYYLPNYLTAMSMYILGPTPLATRLPAALFGLASIIMVYFLAKNVFNRPVGWIASLLTTFSYWEIAWSRQARMYMALQFFFLASLLCFFKLLNKFSWPRLIATILLTLAAILCQPLAVTLLPIYFLALIAQIFFQSQKHQTTFWTYLKNKYQALLSDAWQKIIFWLIILSGLLIIFYFSGQTGLNIFRQQHFATAGQYLKFFWTTYLLTVVLAGGGFLVFALSKQRLILLSYIIIAWATPFLTISLSSDVFNGRYLFFLLPLLFILNAVAIYIIVKKITRRPKIQFLIGGALILLIISLSPEYVIKPHDFYQLENITPQPDFKTAYNVIKKAGFNQDDIIISPYTPLDKIYLGQTDYALPIALTGKPSELNALKESGFDSYNGSPLIIDAGQLENIATHRHGFLIIDDMAATRLDKDILDFIRNDLKSFWRKTPGHFSNIWIYKF